MKAPRCEQVDETVFFPGKVYFRLFPLFTVLRQTTFKPCHGGSQNEADSEDNSSVLLMKERVETSYFFFWKCPFLYPWTMKTFEWTECNLHCWSTKAISRNTSCWIRLFGLKIGISQNSLSFFCCCFNTCRPVLILVFLPRWAAGQKWLTSKRPLTVNVCVSGSLLCA